MQILHQVKIIGLLLLLFASQANLAAQPRPVCGVSDSVFIQFLKNFQKNKPANATPRGVLVIPVVVHLVYQQEEWNFSDEEIALQMQVLNEDFNAQKINTTLLPEQFVSVIGNPQLQFCLATTDPDGNQTSGITRKAAPADQLFGRSEEWLYFSDSGGQDAWDTNYYLNIWVTQLENFAGNGTAPQTVPLYADGVIVDVRFFGAGGHTLTHEVGHYFGLLHPWGNELNCDENDDDGIADTPLQAERYFNCPVPNSATCGSTDITANFMNYGDDECLTMFTKGQAQRMRTILMTFRQRLLHTNTFCAFEELPDLAGQDVLIYPNPSTGNFWVQLQGMGDASIPYRIVDVLGKELQRGYLLPLVANYWKLDKKGIFFLITGEGEEMITKKIVVE